jgi:8-oxo-dGTP diphosphatase
MDFAIAVKSFIVKDGKFLMLKRRPDDVHKPDIWDIPGGRLEAGENPFEGLKRETKEETNLDIDIIFPIEVKSFSRDDLQRITMIIFLCRPGSDDVRLSEEHQDHKWADIDENDDTVPEFFKPTIKNFLSYKKGSSALL